MLRDNFVSIILPLYNAELFVADAIKSVLDQKFVDFELIVINDCSTDTSRDIVLSYAEKYSNITLIDLECNSGAGIARNAGLLAALGRFVAFIDSDDLWLPNKLAMQLNYIKDKDAAICHTSYSIIDESGRNILGGVVASDFVKLVDYMKTTQIGLSTAIVDRFKTGNFKFDSVRTRQDTLLWISLLSIGHCSVGLKNVLVNYRVRKGQISGNKFYMLYRTFKVYWSVKLISPSNRIYCFLQYCLNGLLKRLSLFKP